MKKRVLAALLCVAMTATLLVGCTGETGGTEDSGSQPTETGSEDPAGTDEGTEKDTQGGSTDVTLSVEPVVYYPFESTDEGWKVVVEDTSKAANNAYDPSNLDAGTLRSIVDGDMATADLTHPGVAGQSLYFNRSYGIDLNFDATNTDAYTLSFWVWGLGMTDYMPTLQLGHNIGYAALAGNDVTWLNVTKTSWVGDVYPMLWSRNEVSNAEDGTECFPWMWAYDDTLLRGYQDWVNVTIVATGDIYTSPVGTQAAGCQLYLDGVLVYDSFDNYNNATYFEVTDGLGTLAPNIMKEEEGKTFEAYFGINYWDTLFGGCVDEFYVFDQALSADDVAALYAMGDGEVDPQIDRSNEPKENPRALLNGIDSVGMNDYTQPWWTDWSEIHEVKEGTTKTITFQNYHTNLNYSNWFNTAVILQSTPEGHSSDATAQTYYEGYSEYAVVRMDNYGWGAGYAETDAAGAVTNQIATATCDWNWDTFKDDTHGATVVLKITNHGTTADIEMEITTTAGTVYHQSYTGIAVTGPVYACLTVEKACNNITSVE